MFGSNNGRSSSPGSSNSAHIPGPDYALLGDAAHHAGNLDEAVHLYLLAYDSFEKEPAGMTQAGIDCLHKAWDDALALKDRSLAEYVFEKLEQYCTSEEVADHAEKLQRLALDKLEEFGISPEDIQEMANMVADDFLDGSTLHITPEVFFSTRKSAQDKKSEANDEETGIVPQSSESSSSKETKPAKGQPGGNGITFAYRDLVGYDRAIDQMHNRGIGLSEDSHFASFLSMLSRRHGIDSIPAHHTLLFRAYSREDANQFMAATVGEMGLPTVRMYMEDTPQGFPILLVTASPDIKPRNQFTQKAFDGPGVLVLEDIDTWGAPLAGMDDYDPITFTQLSRGAREAIMFIRAAVENSEVTVLASCASDANLDDFFLDLLNPVLPIDIDVPDDQERADVWKHAASLYPSLRFIDRADLVRLSRNMTREDIYLAARESVEQAYRQSIEKRSFVPVTRDNIFDKVAAYQPLDSHEYQELEDAAVRSWRTTIDNLEDLINKEGE